MTDDFYEATRVLLGEDNAFRAVVCGCVFAKDGPASVDLLRECVRLWHARADHCVQISDALKALTLVDNANAHVWVKLAEQFIFDEQPEFANGITVKEAPFVQGAVLGVLKSLDVLFSAPFREACFSFLVRCMTEGRCHNSNIELAGRDCNGKFINELSSAAKALVDIGGPRYEFVREVIRKVGDVTEAWSDEIRYRKTLGDSVLDELTFAVWSKIDPWQRLLLLK